MKAEKYILNIENALKSIKQSYALEINSKEVDSVIQYVHDYLSDSKFYLREKRDITNSLISSSYAEGLLDAMRLLKIIEFSWKKGKVGA